MKISVNDQELFTLSDTQKKVIMNDIPEGIFHDDMCRRLEYILTHKYERCFSRLKAEWDSKFEAAGIDMLPTKPEAYAELVFKQSEYKSRQQREDEAEAARSKE